ncbi:hypothetical protein ANO11243_000320 [Dothideomycetidae sp. 11243]|nr:hypothetical protein ANO11243_000320 [fungal sp. No.11243]
MFDHHGHLPLQTSALELKYERSTHLVDVIVRDENMRLLRFDKHVLEDDNAELRELLLSEQERSDKMESLMNQHLARAEAAEAMIQGLESTAQIREQELSSLEAERNALKNLTTDTSKMVTERLELTHELSRLKPELEHLRAQVSSNEGLLTEKLSLQRKISEMEVELEDSKRNAQRAIAKRRNTMHEVAQEDELESRENAADTEKAEQSAETEKEKAKAERALAAAQAASDSAKAVLEDKLTQYKNRVRTLKDRLKETEAALEEAQAAATAAAAHPQKQVTIALPPAVAGGKQQGKGGRKRAAGSMEADATTLGTPGDAPAKRARKGASVGEKSSFSITPFLNRTISLTDDGPGSEGEKSPTAALEEAGDKSVDEEEEEPTPSAAAKKSKQKKVPLPPVPASKQNIKKPKTSKSEAETRRRCCYHNNNNDDRQTQAFALEPEPEKKKAKARRLGGLGKTLFDDEDDATSTRTGGGLFGGGKLGPLATARGGGGSFLAGGGAAAKKAMLRTEDGFAFSPLKRDRKAGLSFLK